MKVTKTWGVPITDHIERQAPIASFSYGVTQGQSAVFNTLTAGTYGITIYEWNGPPVSRWTKGLTPVTMSEVKYYTSIATNSFARPYAKVDGINGTEVWEFQMESDLKTWSKIGPVNTGA